MIITVECTCTRCEHKWVLRKDGKNVDSPKYCPKCKSNLWDKARKRAFWNGHGYSFPKTQGWKEMRDETPVSNYMYKNGCSIGIKTYHSERGNPITVFPNKTLEEIEDDKSGKNKWRKKWINKKEINLLNKACKREIK